jgi:hypothetical protein
MQHHHFDNGECAPPLQSQSHVLCAASQIHAMRWHVVGAQFVHRVLGTALYGIPRDYKENERVKGAYLIAFASDLAPICKEWARGCIERCNQKASDAVFVEIVLFNEALKAQMMDAISRHELQVTICEVTNTCTVI